jgi:hypothetical protein
MYRGSCQCGAIQYEAKAVGPIAVCHCKRCRKANGTAFNAIVPVDAADFTLLSGDANLAKYESSPGVGRYFCKKCGSPIYSRRDAMPELLRIRIGTLDTPLPGKPTVHIFVGSKAEWFDIHDDAAKFDERPPA